MATRTRSPEIPVRTWWVNRAIELMEQATGRRPPDGNRVVEQRTLEQLGRDLHRHVRRDERAKPFSHSLLSRFMNRKVGVTLDLADALVHEFLDLPMPLLFPESAEEALALMHTASRYRRGREVSIHDPEPAPVVPMPRPMPKKRAPRATAESAPLKKAHGRR